MLVTSSRMSKGNRRLGTTFMIPSVSMPGTTRQPFGLVQPRTVSTAASHPSTITASCPAACLASSLRRADVHMQTTN